MVGAAKQALERGVGGDVQNPQRNRQLLTPKIAGSALTVPPRGETSDEVPDVPPHSESFAEHLSDLAHGHDVPLMTAYRAREPGGAPYRANKRRAVRVGQCLHDPCQCLSRRPEDDRVEVLQQGPIGEQLRRDLRIGGTSRPDQEAAVVRLLRRRGVHAHPLS